MRWALVVLSLSAWAAAQDNSREQPATTPAPAFGQNAPILNPENPPISGLDAPSLELRTASRSFIAPALQLSQSADTNAGGQFGGSDVEGITRFLGALDLQRFWSKSDFLAEYLGGGAFYSRDSSVRQIQALGLEAITRWRTGQATLRDAFSYLPEGAFSLGFGDPGLGLATGTMGTGEGLPGFHGSSNGSVGLIPRLANSAALDIVQSVSPRSAFTFAGGFSNAHYYDNTLDLINSDQTTIQGGYSHLLNRRDQIAGVYGFQLFRFPQGTGGQLQNHIFNLRWGHTISGKMSLIAGAGPQYTIIQFPSAPDTKHWSVNGHVQLRYRFARTSLVLAYEKYTASGSGFFAGSDTQRARFGVKRELGRTMNLLADLGYSHNKSLQPFSGAGVAGNRYDEGFVGAILRKHFGRQYDVFAAYHFSEIGFDNADPVCGFFGAGACSNISQRHAGTVGVEWHPTPIRIE
ncbi:MAG: hypothetical protein LAO22_09845 [Acidobacteriia bacterium]|nr:hypothetical protein [Terriglobia bacterium]